MGIIDMKKFEIRQLSILECYVFIHLTLLHRSLSSWHDLVLLWSCGSSILGNYLHLNISLTCYLFLVDIFKYFDRDANILLLFLSYCCFWFEMASTLNLKGKNLSRIVLVCNKGWCFIMRKALDFHRPKRLRELIKFGKLILSSTLSEKLGS